MMLHKMYKITNTGNIKIEDFNRITKEVIDYFFSKTKLSNMTIEEVEILRINDFNEVILKLHLINKIINLKGGYSTTRNARVASLNISLTKLIRRDRDNKLNKLFDGN